MFFVSPARRTLIRVQAFVEIRKIVAMPKVELTKTIEARKLNKRTLRPLTPDFVTIPFGAILEGPYEDRDWLRFQYLGEPYEAKLDKVKSAIKNIEG